MSKRLLVILIFSLLIGGCAVLKNRQSHQKLRTLALQKQYDKALKVIETDSFFKEKESLLLTYLEKGTLFYLNGQYEQSLKLFDQAQELSDKLFTKSLKKKLLSSVTNNNLDNFYGAKYERSLIRFYQSLNHLQLSYLAQKPKDKAFHLSAARANILNWDTLLENYKAQFAGDSDYKVDMMAKLYGAFIHEMIGSRSDKQIARTLYLNAKDILLKNYNLYPSFNNKFKKFADDYEDLPKLSRSKLKKKYIDSTLEAKNLLSFIDKRLKDLKKKNKENVRIIFQKGMIAKKVGKQIKIPLPHTHFVNLNEKTYNILSFTIEVLSIAHGTQPSISYEVPSIENQPIDHDYSLVIKDEKNKLVKEEKLILANPLSEIAYQHLENKIAGVYTKLGTRIAVKHMSAILAAYQIYKSNPSAATKFAASLAYAAANKVIEESERVDLRFWSLLPSSQYLSSFELKKGKYKVFLKGHSKDGSLTLLKDLEINGEELKVYDLRAALP